MAVILNLKRLTNGTNKKRQKGLLHKQKQEQCNKTAKPTRKQIIFHK